MKLSRKLSSSKPSSQSTSQNGCGCKGSARGSSCSGEENENSAQK